jgi:hypothetical protein
MNCPRNTRNTRMKPIKQPDAGAHAVFEIRQPAASKSLLNLEG